MKKGIVTVLLMFFAVVAGVALRYYVQTGSFLPNEQPAQQTFSEQPEAEPEDAEPTDTEPADTEPEEVTEICQLPTDNDWGVTLTAKDVTSDGITLVCSQSGGNPTGELSTGPWYEIEKQVSGKWQQAPIYAEVCWEDIAWIIPKEDLTEWQVNWTWIYGSLEPGEYRIAKEIMDFRQSGDFDTCRSYAYFTIE